MKKHAETGPDKTPARRRTAGAPAVLAFLLVSAVGSILGTYLYFNSAPRKNGGNDAIFSVRKGETVSEIAGRLEKEGHIRSASLLIAQSRIARSDAGFRAGYYRIPAGADTASIRRLLVQGAQVLEKTTIPEGWTVSKIAEYLEEKGICGKAEFLNASRSAEILGRYGISGPSLEGYLFPDTYFIPQRFPAEDMCRIMVETFFERLQALAPEAKGMRPEEIRRKVILASIVEREYRAAEEAPSIASVFYNRLERNIGLESCATLEYIITEIQEKPHPGYITFEDKKIDSPYNTYLWAGLPPGPIANPGRIALDAAFHPARTDYYYFVLQDTAAGRHHFSRNLEEHNQAKFQYLKKSGQGN